MVLGETTAAPPKLTDDDPPIVSIIRGPPTYPAI
jgi:hypothetical protein